MSGLMGSITGASNEFNELSAKDTIKGIKTAGNLYGRITEAELAKKEEMAKATKEETSIDSSQLVQEIQDEMEL